MSISLARLGSAVAISAMLGLASSSRAVPLTWEPDGIVGNPIGGSGIWNTTNSFWNNAGVLQSWSNLAGDVAVFTTSAGTPAGPYTVTIDTGVGGLGVSAGGLTFNANGYTVASDELSELLTLTGATPTVTVTNAADTATITSIIDGIAGLTTAGSGTLVLGGANTFTGNVSIGTGSTLFVSADNNLGAAANGVTISAGTLRATGTFTAARAVTLGVGGGTISVTGAGNTLTLSAALAATADALTKSDDGNLTLGVASTRTGTTLVSGGSLQLTVVSAAGTGDITVNAGASLISAHNAATQNFPANVVINGGSFIHNPGANQQLNFLAGKSIAIGAAGGTIEVSPGGGSTSKILLTADQLSSAAGSMLTKTGPGVVQLSGANTGFLGNVTINAGTLEFQNANALGAGTITVTVGGTGDFALNSGALTARHNFILNNGGTLSANGTVNTVNYTGAINVAGNANIALRYFQTVTTADSFRIGGTLSGSGGLNVTAPAAATLTLSGNNSAYTGNITINTNATVAAAGTQALAGAESVTLNGGTLSLLADGNGLGTLEPPISFTDPITVTANSAITVGRVGTGVGTGPAFQQAANKIIQQNGTLTINGQTLTINNNNGYGLDLTALLLLPSAPTFSVTTATNSNVVQGLTLSGQVTGNSSFIKAGAGTLTLTNAGNDFVGSINVTQGVLAISGNSQLGNAANLIVLNPSTGTSTLRATDNVMLAHTVQLATSANTRTIEVVGGKTLSLTTPLDIPVPAATLIKADNGTLALTVGNPATWTGGVTINGGTVLVSDPAAFGSPTATVTISPGAAVFGAALQLTGGILFPNPVSLQGTNNVLLGGINFGGQLQSVSGSNTTTGSIIVNFDAAIGADTSATLNVNGGINNTTASARSLAFTGGGTININSSMTAATATANQYFALQKYGSGTLNFTTAQPLVFSTGSTQNLTFFAGQTNFTDAGTLAGTPAIAATINPGAIVELNNTASVVANRLGGRGLTLLGGNFNYVGGAALSNETMGALAINRGHDTITVTAAAGGANLAFGAPTRAGGSTALFRGSALGTTGGANVATIASTTTGFTFSGAGGIDSPNKGMLPWALVSNTPTGVGQSFATADAATGILRPLSALEVSTSILTGNNISLTTPESVASNTAINSLTLGAGGGITTSAGSTLTVSSGGILALGPSNTISGGILTQGTGELIIHTVGNLDIGSVITGGSGGAAFALTKGGGGTLTLSQPSRHSGQTVITQGTLVLNAGNNTIALQNYLVVGKGATLDLNGTTQLVTDLFNDGVVADAAGTVTGNASSMIVLNRDASDRSWAGRMTGGMSFARSGGNTLSIFSNNDFTGRTILTGGTTTLRDQGQLSATSAIDISNGTLQLNNSVGSTALTNRVNDAAQISLRTGAIVFNSRAQTAGSETFGELRLVSGSNNLNPIRANVGIESIDMIFDRLTLVSPDAMTNFNGTNGTFGQVGNNFRILFNTPPTVTNNIVSPAVESGGNEFATYIPGLGLTALSSVGAPGYDSTTLPAASQPTQNIRLAASATVATGGLTINTLNQVGNVNITFNDANDVLNLNAGGYIKQGNNTVSLGGTVDSGRLTAGGTASTGTVPLYIHIGSAAANPLTINSRIIDNPNGAKVRIVYTNFNGGTMSLTNGLNSYTGGTVVNGWVNNNTGSLTLNGAAGQVVIPAGGLTIDNSTVTEVVNGGQINPANVVTLRGNSTLTLVGANSLAGITFDNAGGIVNPVVNTGGVLTLPGGTVINATSANLGSTAQINGTLDFAGASPTITVGSILVNGVNVAPFQVVMNLGAVLQNAGGLTKAGPGVVGIGAANTYTGATNISAGTVQFTAANAGAANSNVTVSAGGTLNLGGFNGTIGSLSGAGAITNTLNGVQLGTASNLTLGAVGLDTLFSGLINGAVALIKTGSGSFGITNTANSFTGGITVNAGSLLLPGAGLSSTGTGLVTVNNGASINGGGLLPGGLTLNPGSSASIALSATAPLSTGSAAIVTAGPTTLNITGAPSVGTFPLIDYGGSAMTQAQFAGLKLGTTPGGGFLYALSNNSANTSVDLSVEAVGASNTWTGGTDGTWAPGNVSNWTSAYADGQQVTFNNSGANKAVIGGAVSPQAITVNNTTGNDYSIANPIGGTLAGGLAKSGTGTLRLTGANTFSGAVNVSGGGTLRASVSSAASSLGSGALTLNGSTLLLDPTATATVGLTGRTISGAVTNNVVAQRDFNATALDARTYVGTGNFDLSVTSFYTGGPADNFSMQFTGKLNITTPGYYSFFSTSDDGSRAFVDGYLVAQNDGSHGVGTDVGGNSIFLSAGYHDLRVEQTEGTGTTTVEQLRWQGPGFGKSFVPSSVLFTPEISSVAGTNNNIVIGNNVSVAGNSTINLNGTNFTGVEIGGLTPAAGSTLSVNGLAGKQLRATATTLSGGTTTINATADVALGQLRDGGVASTLVKQGTGRLILDNTFGTGRESSLLAASTIDVQAGKLVLVGSIPTNTAGATNPAGGAKIQLSGGSLVLDTKGSNVAGGGTTTFDNAVVTTQSSLIEVVPTGGIVAGVSIPVALGSATNGITLANGSTLTVDVFGGARSATALANNFVGNTVVANGANFVAAGVISGSAGVTIRTTQFNGGQLPVAGNAAMTAANTYSGATTLRGQIYNAPNVLGGGLVSAAVASGAPLTLTLSGNGSILNTSSLAMTNARLTLDAGGTTNGDRIADTLPVSLNSSVLQFIGNTTANSGETFDVLTANSGFNAVTMSGVGASVAGTLTGASLARANNAQIAFQGSTLGGQAINVNLVKFNTAPTAQLVGGGNVIGGTNKDVSILPYAVGTGNTTGTINWTFVGYDATNGIRPLSQANEFEAMSATTANANVRDAFAVATSITARATPINSWIIDDTSTTGGPHAATLTGTATITSGALLLASSSATPQALSLTGGNVDFGTAEGVITVMSNAGATISSVLQNTGGNRGLTVGGTGQLALAGVNTFTGPVTVNGQLSIAADSALGVTSNPINLNGGILRISAATTLPATRTVTLLADTISGVDTAAVNSVISGQVTGGGGLAKINTGTLTLSAANNNYTGRTEVYAGSLVTSSGPTGDYLNNGNVTFDQSTNGTYNGVITGFGTFTKSGTGNVTLGASSNYTGVTLVSAGTITAAVDQALPNGGQVTLGNNAIIGTAGSLDLTNANQNLGGTFAVQSDNATGSQVTIGSGKTLTINGSVIVGVNLAALTTTKLIATGGGSLIVNNPASASVFQVGNYSGATAGQGNIATVDLSGLNSFNLALNTTNGVLRVNNPSGVNTSNVFSTLLLPTTGAGTSNITAATMAIGDNGQNSNAVTNQVKLGSGVSTINVNTLNIGTGGRDAGSLTFTNASGSLSLHDTTGAGPVTLNMGTGGATTAVIGTNTFDTTGHQANLSFGAVNMSTQPRNSVLTSNLSFNQGTLDMTSLTMSIRTSSGGTDGGANKVNNSTVNLGGGTVNIANGVLQMANVTASTFNNSTVNATLNVSGGTVNIGATSGISLNMAGAILNHTANATFTLSGGVTTLAGDIVKIGGAGTTTATLNLTGGTLDMQGHNIGGATPINNLNFASGTLSNVAEINAGASGVSKIAPGTLILAGTNTYTGPTAVSDGTLLVSGSLSGTVSVTASGTATLGGTGTIASLTTVQTGATLAPGASVGTLTFANTSLTLGAGFTYRFEGGTTSDLVKLTGVTSTLSLDDVWTLKLSNLDLPNPIGRTFILFDGAIGAAGLDGLVASGPVVTQPTFDYTGTDWSGGVVSYDAAGNDIILTQVIPEPGSAVTLVCGMASLLGLRRFRRRS